MKFSEINPFVRYVHYLPLDSSSEYGNAVPYDNRLFFTCFGNGKISVGDKVYLMKKGAVLIIPSGCAYSIHAPEEKVVYIAVNFDYTQKNKESQKPLPPTSPENYNSEMRLEENYFEDLQNFNMVVYLENMFKLDTVFTKIHREYLSRMIMFDSIVSNLLSGALLECARASLTVDFKENNDTVSRITDYIKENYGKKLTNKIIADAFNLHPNYISALIKRFCGMPLHQYVIQVRISASVEMLITQKYSIEEIADRCGFLNIFHFSRVFKNVMGISPSKYK